MDIVEEPSGELIFPAVSLMKTNFLYARTSQNECYYSCDTGEWKYRGNEGCEEIIKCKVTVFLDNGTTCLSVPITEWDICMEQTDFKMINTDTFQQFD